RRSCRRRPPQPSIVISTTLTSGVVGKQHPGSIKDRWRYAMSKARTASWACALSFVLTPLAAHAQNQGPGLPEGEGKQLVETVCTACHLTNMITGSSGYTQAGWKELTSTMVDLSHVPDQWDTITKYLATNFPPNTKRAPTLVPGDFKIAFKEWKVP